MNDQKKMKNLENRVIEVTKKYKEMRKKNEELEQNEKEVEELRQKLNDLLKEKEELEIRLNDFKEMKKDSSEELKQNNSEVNIINAEINVKDSNKEIKILDDNFKNEITILFNGNQIKSYYKFEKKGKHPIIYIFNKLLLSTEKMFDKCSSLTSLNLSNFNTNNVKDMNHMFSGLNNNCKIETNDKKILDAIKCFYIISFLNLFKKVQQ